MFHINLNIFEIIFFVLNDTQHVNEQKLIFFIDSKASLTFFFGTIHNELNVYLMLPYL